jgi:hypothetical protein
MLCHATLSDHLATNLRAAWTKANKYYSKLHLSPVYYAATILHPYCKTYCDTAWAEKPDWLNVNNEAFQALWGEYKGIQVRQPPSRPTVIINDIEDAIEAVINPKPGVATMDNDNNEYVQWRQREPPTLKGSFATTTLYRSGYQCAIASLTSRGWPLTSSQYPPPAAILSVCLVS